MKQCDRQTAINSQWTISLQKCVIAKFFQLWAPFYLKPKWFSFCLSNQSNWYYWKSSPGRSKIFIYLKVRCQKSVWHHCHVDSCRWLDTDIQHCLWKTGRWHNNQKQENQRLHWSLLSWLINQIIQFKEYFVYWAHHHRQCVHRRHSGTIGRTAPPLWVWWAWLTGKSSPAASPANKNVFHLKTLQEQCNSPWRLL